MVKLEERKIVTLLWHTALVLETFRILVKSNDSVVQFHFFQGTMKSADMRISLSQLGINLKSEVVAKNDSNEDKQDDGARQAWVTAIDVNTLLFLASDTLIAFLEQVSQLSLIDSQSSSKLLSEVLAC